MTLVRWITEMGMGVDVHGGDYTKAARRAVSDALRHSSLNFFDAAGKTVHDMHVEVVIAVSDPAAVDTEAVASEVPYGTVTITPVAGGLDVPAPRAGDRMVIANAAVLVSFEDGEEPIGEAAPPSPSP
ncbi:MAG: Lin0512 family protein [Actinomycetota bacterium]